MTVEKCYLPRRDRGVRLGVTELSYEHRLLGTEPLRNLAIPSTMEH